MRITPKPPLRVWDTALALHALDGVMAVRIDPDNSLWLTLRPCKPIHPWIPATDRLVEMAVRLAPDGRLRSGLLAEPMVRRVLDGTFEWKVNGYFLTGDVGACITQRMAPDPLAFTPMPVRRTGATT